MNTVSLDSLPSWDEPAGESLEDQLIEAEECLQDMMDHELVAKWSEGADPSVAADEPANVQPSNRFISKL